MLTRVARLTHVLRLVHWAAHRSDVHFFHRFEVLMVATKNEHEPLADGIVPFRTAKVLPRFSRSRSPLNRRLGLFIQVHRRSFAFYKDLKSTSLLIAFVGAFFSAEVLDPMSKVMA
jgi:hypothetical protein